ncbi:MAG TPA: hypothetical protein VFE84_14750 [Patescibacteria group bacterium]|nr:hypothetical protein [Patescibacteria group bacterium]
MTARIMKSAAGAGLLLAVVCAMGAAPARAAEQHNAGFDKLKTLVGEWDAKTSEGATVKVTYKLMSAGTALMETIGANDMATLYHPDGDAVMLTHYCEANNQPRMRASRLSADGSTLDFKFVDVTNEAYSSAGIMKNVRITFQDADHFVQEWTYHKDGKETPEKFTYSRRK